MQTSANFDAIVEIATKRDAAIVRRDKQDTGSFGWHHEQGIVYGLCTALILLSEAGEHVASAEYMAAGGELVGVHATPTA